MVERDSPDSFKTKCAFPSIIKTKDVQTLPRAQAVVMTVNANKQYLDWSSFVCKAWENIGIDPHVFMIGGSYKKDADSCKYHVFNMETNISTKTLSQISRLLFPATLVKYQNVMISDIDSIPIPSSFWDLSGGYPLNSFVNMRHKPKRNAYMGYNSASPATWKKLFWSKATIEETLNDWHDNQNLNWDSDQKILNSQIHQYEPIVWVDKPVFRVTIRPDNTLWEQPLTTNSNIQKKVSQINCDRHIWIDSFSPGERVHGTISEQLKTLSTQIPEICKKTNKCKNIRTQKLPSGVQMTLTQIDKIFDVLPKDGNLLVFGLGYDSTFWNQTTCGHVVFIEDNDVWIKKIKGEFGWLEVEKVHYNTHLADSYSKYMNQPDLWHELSLALPLSIKSIEWDVIIVDAPCGNSNNCPGRYGSIYTSKTLSGPKTHIFVDDFERKVEHDFSTKVFGSKPLGIIERPHRKHANANTQAHFYGFPV